MGCVPEHKVRLTINSDEENFPKQRCFSLFSRASYGVTIAGEWSNAINDCGLFMRGVGGRGGAITYGGNCSDWQDASKWTDGTKAGILAFSSASMDALRDWFFWTWKVSSFFTSLAPHTESGVQLNRSAIPQPESSNLLCGHTSWVFIKVGCLLIPGLS